jgi:hypothetical protein
MPTTKIDLVRELLALLSRVDQTSDQKLEALEVVIIHELNIWLETERGLVEKKDNNPS